MLRQLIVICIAVILSACASPPPTTISSIQDDVFSKSITINGAELSEFPNFGTKITWSIRSWVDKKTGSVTHQLYAAVDFDGDFRDYLLAADDTATSLKVIPINATDGICIGDVCRHIETIGIELNDTTLRARINKPYSIKIIARNGPPVIVTITPLQIKLQLQAIDKYTNAHHT